MSSLERAECVCEPRNSPGKLRKGNESDRADRGCQGLVLALKHVEYRLFNPLVEAYANSSRTCVCVGLQGVSIINEKRPTVSGFLRERSGRGGSRGKELRG